MPEIDLDYLAHHGILGMRWGHRTADSDREEGTESGISSKHIDREAKKDATEFTKAKAYYGEGAGTRRKLIKARVEGKSKASPDYAKAFDYHVSNTDTNKRANQAVAQRHRTDARNKTTKTARGIGHIIRGNPQYASLAAATIAGGAVYIHSKGYDKVAYSAAKKFVSSRL